MSQLPTDFEMTVEFAVNLFLLKRLHPQDFLTRIDPWRRFIEAPIWRNAKPLLNADPNLVLAIVERIVSGQNGSYDPAELMCLGKVRQSIGDHARALEVFDLLVKRDDRNYQAMYNAALCHIALGDMPRAEALLKRILQIRPRDSRAMAVIRESFGNLYFTLRASDDAEDEAAASAAN